MNYKIEITKIEKNPNFQAEMAEYNKINTMYQKYDERPVEEKVIRTLVVELTEDEYQKVKSEVIKIFE